MGQPCLADGCLLPANYDRPMKAVIQRVSEASLEVIEPDGPQPVAQIDRGFVVLLGAVVGDTPEDARWIAAKVTSLRVFPDDQGKMNLALGDVGGSVLLVPNFTVAGDAQKGRRPSFDLAMRPPESKALFDRVATELSQGGVPTQTGVFGADMRVTIVNDGPVTLVVDSRATRQG